MTIFDILLYPIPSDKTYLHVIGNLPVALTDQFLNHPEFQKFSKAPSLVEFNARIDANTALLRRLILEWDE